MELSKTYRRLTVRQLYYLLVSRHSYPPTRCFYKTLVYHLVKLRRAYPSLYLKFFIAPPRIFGEVELWVEKDSIRSFVEDLAAGHRVPIQVQRGFGTLSMYRHALIRARERGVRKILYIGDFDPSGLVIEDVTAKEMGIDVERVALTLEQVRKFNPPSRLVNTRDSRTPSYVRKYGNRCWEVEALNPDVFLGLVEARLKPEVPREVIVEAGVKDRASEIARLLTESLVRTVESEVYDLPNEGVSDDEVAKRLASKYSLRIVRDNTR